LEIINTPIEVFIDNIENTRDLYFVISSNEPDLTSIRPDTYVQLKNKNRKDIFDKLLKRDETYRSDFIEHPSTVSFVHASIAGFSTLYDYTELFDSEYYTYYFKLTLQELSKCVFSITDAEGNVGQVAKGVAGTIAALKTWNNNRKTLISTKDENGNTICNPQINAVIPFKIKPVYCLPPAGKRKYYHGSTKKLDKIKAWSYVTPYKEDAKSFSVPWSSSDLVYTEHETSLVEGRPPQNLCFRRDVKVPNDRKIYLYELSGVDTISCKSNTGKEYPWNRVLVKECEELNIEVIDSWKKEFKLK
jgi:hypothetical protein